MVFSRQKVDNGIINVDYIKKAKQSSNIFTKILEKIEFDKYKSMLNLKTIWNVQSYYNSYYCKGIPLALLGYGNI